jgi:signal transduction histidine kinase
VNKFILLLFFACSALLPAAQQGQSVSGQQAIDSLQHELAQTKNDTLRLVLFSHLRYNYFFVNTNLDSTFHYSKLILQIAQKLNYKIDEAHAWNLVGDVMNFLQNEHTLEAFFKGVKIAEDPEAEKKILPKKYLERMLYWETNFTAELAANRWSPHYFRLGILASLYLDLSRAYLNIMPNQQRLFSYLSKAIAIHVAHKDTINLAFDYSTLAIYFHATDQFDSSLFYAQKSYDLRIKKIVEAPFPAMLPLIGTQYYKKGNHPLALSILRQSIQTDSAEAPGSWLAYFTLSEYFLRKGVLDSSLFFAKKAYGSTRYINTLGDRQIASNMLARVYKATGNNDSALKYFESALALNDSINNANKRRKLQSQDFDEQVQQQEAAAARVAFRNQIKVYTLIVGLSAVALIALILLRNNRQKQKANTRLQLQKDEIDTQRSKLQQSLDELKAMQAQLVQREKMASLGELTAGIAHEIQNPLNFVNNFSETNTELIEEAQTELKAGNVEEVQAILTDIKGNEEKINTHGKRADAIVKGMLQHSRKNIGEKQLTDINALTDEYLRLSYHGMRAKDKSFKTTMRTSFDENIGKANMVPQDIGRVLLNLFNNAFYAVNEKEKTLGGVYEPMVSISTRKVSDKIEISVQDNGMGILKSLIDKIFQPFFTTKPTGQGTGLGLSLSYDIIKAHGGELKVESTEGEGSVFTITIPKT